MPQIRPRATSSLVRNLNPADRLCGRRKFGESIKLVFVVGRDAQDGDTNSTIDEPFGSIDFNQLEIEVTSVGFKDAILVHPFPVD